MDGHRRDDRGGHLTPPGSEMVATGHYFGAPVARRKVDVGRGAGAGAGAGARGGTGAGVGERAGAGGEQLLPHKTADILVVDDEDGEERRDGGIEEQRPTSSPVRNKVLLGMEELGGIISATTARQLCDVQH
eukprot:2788102-Rhodomonas_salina.3